MAFARDSAWLRVFWVVLWLAFTMAFAAWWYTLISQHITLLSELQPERAELWLRKRRMILWEGFSWIVLLTIGGGALIVLVQNEKLRIKRIKEFFASFSHEVKTSLASLRIQAEALKDEATESSPILDRLIGDTVRLQVQLENSLFLSSQDHLKLYLEPIHVSTVVERMREQWPAIEIILNKDARVRADDRALRTIFSNLMQNAIVHGKATRVSIDVVVTGDRVVVSVRDDGAGYQGDTARLGELFHRPTPQSGSGLGLYISRLLVQRMGGRFMGEFKNGRGFNVRFDLPGEVK